jgi:hypothetical protein
VVEPPVFAFIPPPPPARTPMDAPCTAAMEMAGELILGRRLVGGGCDRDLVG